MTSPFSSNEDKDAWLLKIELKREEPEEINKDEGIKKAMEVQAPVVKTFGSLYNEFLLTKICNIQENGVPEAYEVATR